MDRVNLTDLKRLPHNEQEYLNFYTELLLTGTSMMQLTSTGIKHIPSTEYKIIPVSEDVSQVAKGEAMSQATTPEGDK